MCESPKEEDNSNIRKIERHSSVQLHHKDKGINVVRKVFGSVSLENISLGFFRHVNSFVLT